jgi:drug/metabolite transporter (DMT)-like permease
MNEKITTYSQFWGVLIVLLGSIMFSTKAVFVKLAYQYDINSVTLLMFRMLFALPFYIAIAFVSSKKKNDYQVTKKDIQSILLLGIVGYYMASFLDFQGLKYISASLERLILFTYPTIVLLIGVFFYKEKITRHQIAALVLAYIGISIVFLGNDDSSITFDNLLLGSAYVLGCAIAYAIYLVGSGRIIPRLGTWRYTSYVLIVACVFVILHYLVANRGIGSLDFPLQVYIYAMLMATLSTVIPTLLISEGIRLIGASNASIVGSAGPISTITLAYIFLGERLTLIQMFGGILVLSGVLIISLQKKKK